MTVEDFVKGPKPTEGRDSWGRLIAHPRALVLDAEPILCGECGEIVPYKGGQRPKWCSKHRRERDRKAWSNGGFREHQLARYERVYGLNVDAITELDFTHCQLCNAGPSLGKNGKRCLVVDHDHKTGAFRGILCRQCNAALGMLNDDPVLIRKLLVYLEDE